MKTQFGELITGDFESNTMTFDMVGEGMELRAGEYAIVPIKEYKLLIQQNK